MSMAMKPVTPDPLDHKSLEVVLVKYLKDLMGLLVRRENERALMDGVSYTFRDVFFR